MKNLLPNWKTLFKVAMPFLLAGLVFLLPMEGLSLAGKKSIALLVWLISMYAFEPVPMAISSLLAVPLTVFWGLANVNKALAGYASSSIYLIFGAFIMAAAVEKSRVAERLTYWMLSKIGCTAVRITLGVTITNIVLAFLVPSTAARTALLLPVAMSIIELVQRQNGLIGPNEKPIRSNFAVGLLLILAYTNSIISAGVLTASTPNPVTVDFIFKATGKVISYADWFILGFPPALMMTMFSWWYISTFCKSEVKEIPGGAEYIEQKLTGMGPVKQIEWKTIFVVGLIGVLWATGNITRLDTTMVCLAGSGLFFVLKVINWSDVSKSGALNIMVLMGGGFTVAELLFSTGAAKWIAVSLLQATGMVGASMLTVLLGIIVVVQYSHFIFQGTTKMATILTPIIIAMAVASNIDPAVVALPAGMIIAGYPLVMFYSTISNTIIYDGAIIKFSDFPKFGFPICTVAVLLYVVMALTYWKWMGLY